LSSEHHSEFRARLAAWRELLLEEVDHPRRTARTIERILSRTTRQDLSWRGDLRLWADFLRARWKASPALRVVGASLLLHALAAPAVAYWILREPEPPRPLYFFIEPAVEEFAPELAPATESVDVVAELARWREQRENALCRARFLVRRVTPPELELTPQAPVEVRLLAARARQMRLRAPQALELDARELSSLGLALWLEFQADRVSLGAASDPLVEPLSERLRRTRAELAPEARASGIGAVLGAAERRSRELGWLDGPALDGPEYLSRAWFEALARAGEESGLGAEPLWRAWAAWRAQ
jgi:hypothetical protein